MAEFIQKHKLFSFYSSLMILVVIVAIFAPWLAPGDAFTSNMGQRCKRQAVNTGLVRINWAVMYYLASFMVLNYPCLWVLQS